LAGKRQKTHTNGAIYSDQSCTKETVISRVEETNLEKIEQVFWVAKGDIKTHKEWATNKAQPNRKVGSTSLN